MKFKKSFLMDELDLPWSALEDVVVDTTRWSTVHEIIFGNEVKSDVDILVPVK